MKTAEEEENIAEVLEGKTNIGRKRSRRKVLQEQAKKDDLVSLIQARSERADALKDLNESDLLEIERK